MSKTMKILNIISIVILSMAILVAIVGTALMYTDVYLGVQPSPKSGVLPTVGTIFAIISLVLFCVAKKHNNIGRVLITTVIAQIALYSSVLLIDYGHSDRAWTGWWLCLGSAGAISLVFVLSMTILVANYMRTPMMVAKDEQTAGGKHKVLRILAIIVFIIAIVFAIVGTIIMFNDYTFEGAKVAHRTTAIMPAVGMALLVFSMIQLILSKKNPKWIIGTWGATVVALALLCVSIVFVHSPEALVGYWLCLSASVVALSGFVFSLINGIYSLRNNRSSIAVVSDVSVKMEEARSSSEKYKALRIVTIIVYIVVVALAIIGTIIMFEDSTSYGARVIPYRGTGAMPAGGTALLVLSMILLILSKKNPKWAIGTWVATVVAQALLCVSFVFIRGVAALVGYWLCVSASSVASIGFILSLIYGILSLRGNKTPVASVKDDYKTAFSRATELLKEAKALLDSGIYTEEEFKMQKEMVFKRYGLFGEGKDPENKTEDK